MRDLQLYVITDRSVIGDKALIHIVEAAIEGGAEVIQLRDKNVSARELVEIGKELRALCRDKGVLFIINDRPDVAVAIDCDGVHLGQDDLPIEAARRVVGPDRIIGVSTHSLDQAVRAQEQGADYIGVGPIFATPTKKDYRPVGLKLILQIKEKLSIPFVAIGGINENNIDEVIEAGAECVAVVRAVMGAESPAKAARKLREKISSFKNGKLENK